MRICSSGFILMLIFQHHDNTKIQKLFPLLSGYSDLINLNLINHSVPLSLKEWEGDLIYLKWNKFNTLQIPS